MLKKSRPPEQCVNVLKCMFQSQLLLILSAWQEKLEELEEGKSILAPGGWSGLNGSGFLMHIVERTGKDSYAFVTLNPARGKSLAMFYNSLSGLEYHQQIAAYSDDTPPKHKFKVCLKIADIPGIRMKNLGFWSILFSLWMKDPPSEYHRVEVGFSS